MVGCALGQGCPDHVAVGGGAEQNLTNWAKFDQLSRSSENT